VRARVRGVKETGEDSHDWVLNEQTETSLPCTPFIVSPLFFHCILSSRPPCPRLTILQQRRPSDLNQRFNLGTYPDSRMHWGLYISGTTTF
jgi:hypothetical protein